ncbi:DUF1294 domain-containing protein [Qipengyuania sp. MTN3-11]|uniref:DUF1294 domain-containing protein n=1 Tax=Qipengyuania sp. MTN3-11 TaxID=3056557 RepID=UPI0036F37DA7
MDLLFPLFTPLNIALWLIAINFAAFAAFGIDKARAEAAGPRRGKRRTSEADLLALALLGGTPGAYAGRKLFRHKTRKQPFSSQLHTIAILQIAALAGLGVFLMP